MEREEKGASEGEKNEVPAVAAAVLVCLPADKPQGSHETFEAEESTGVWQKEDMEKQMERGIER